MWGENSLYYKTDYLVIHNHKQLFITLPVWTPNLVERVWDFAFIPWRANFLSRMPKKILAVANAFPAPPENEWVDEDW